MTNNKRRFTLSKEFRFEAAHRLAKGYVGKCANIHGHSWNGTLFVGIDLLNSQDMAIDYARLGEFVKEEVIDRYDHKLLLFRADPLYAILTDKELQGIYPDLPQQQIVGFVGNPTSELLAMTIALDARQFFRHVPGVHIKVEVRETCTTACLFE